MTSEASQLRYIDIGINFTDPIFRGEYHGTQRHENDFEDVIQRAVDAGCKKFMVTGSDLDESKHAIEIAKAHPGLCYATVGVHPCSAKLFDTHPGGPSALLSALKSLALEAKEAGHAVAFGEIGLDYDRLFLTPKDQQLNYFEAQLQIAVEVQLPLFLHSRAASEDFERLLGEKLSQLPKRGLVHSFTGTVEEMQRLVDLGFDIGVNGCSMKTDENIEVVKQIPLERLQIETDGPWCEMRPSHASAKFLKDAPPLPKAVKKEKFVKGLMVKGRNESASIPHVAYAIAKIKGITVEEVCDA
ncbi:deoxyribonuclease tatD [Clathrospora elynae]|uniref:Deoxyribonuclease tatD n=1 Tax=Clathrospora elynae TaxID=706981 RepID=A0A6A5SMF5_9PLEO|nr:deoxyribonuclease tatD [Clathrospora elynae]